MNVRIGVVWVTALLVVSACNSRQQSKVLDHARQESLTAVVNSVTIEGAPEAVFDLVTTARFWPQWHPATSAVGGVTQRPYRLGDRIIERGRIGSGDFKVIWKVAEHIRAQRVVLQSEASPVRISYSFSPRGKATEFTRELKYNAEDLKTVASDPNEVNRLMRAQSEQAVNQLQALVEKILREEAAGTE